MPSDDELTLFHHTSSAAAAAIMTQRRMESAAPVDLPFAFFSNRRHGNASGPLHYGEACVEVRVPRAVLIEDDAFRDGERYYRARLADLRDGYFITAHHPLQDTEIGAQPLARSIERERREAAPPAEARRSRGPRT